MRRFFLPLLLLSSGAAAQPAARDVSLGRPIEGVTMTRQADGTLSLDLGATIILEGGMELRRIEGMRYEVASQEQPPPPAVTLRGLDFLLSGQDHMGRRVKVTGGRLSGADVRNATVSLQGGHTSFDVRDLPREQARYVVENCGGFGTTEAICGFDITGTVTRRTMGDLRLEDVVLERRTSSQQRRSGQR